jgi:sugar phosphate isomerase/epimerase
MKVGTVTYQIGKDMDLPTLLDVCEKTGLEGVELRTTHPHGVEIALSAEERAEVKRRFDDSPVALVGLGTACEYHSLEEAELKKNIEETHEWVKLAADLGCAGVKVRPNGVQTDAGVPLEKTLEQIGLALRECGRAAADCGVQIRCEVHGAVTCQVPNMKTIMDAADHDNVFICWNCNVGETDDSGSINANFDLLKDKIRLVHMRDLTVQEYPWRELFALLKGVDYQGYCLAEIPHTNDPERVLTYYRALFHAFQD